MANPDDTPALVLRISDESKRVSSRIQRKILYQQDKTYIYGQRVQGGEVKEESHHNR